MALPNLYSRRKRLAESSSPDVYSYDKFPSKVRVQVIQILREVIGPWDQYGESADWWNEITNTLRKENGVFYLSGDGFLNREQEFVDWFLVERQVDAFLDALELMCRVIFVFLRDSKKQQSAKIAEINARLREASIGFEYVSGGIVRVDNQIAHSEIVLPALELLNEPLFASANREYRAAHAAFRAGDHETCLVECGKSFESVLKIIGSKRSWRLDANATSSKLVTAAYDHGFVPAYMQSQFSALRALLEGVPSARNRTAAHGAGVQTRNVEDHLAAYQLHQTAAAIIFLAEQHKSLP